MPRYEIVAHVARELACDTPEEAAAVVRDQMAAIDGRPVELLHLAVWREDASPASPSPLPPSLRRRLVEFFAALDRSAAETEAAFRGRVAAILGAPDAPGMEPAPAPAPR